jgi:hypothetical protein
MEAEKILADTTLRLLTIYLHQNAISTRSLLHKVLGKAVEAGRLKVGLGISTFLRVCHSYPRIMDSGAKARRLKGK